MSFSTVQLYTFYMEVIYELRIIPIRKNVYIMVKSIVTRIAALAVIGIAEAQWQQYV